VMIDGGFPRNQLAEAIEQVFETKHRPDALVKRVLVQDQDGSSRAKNTCELRRSIAVRGLFHSNADGSGNPGAP